MEALLAGWADISPFCHILLGGLLLYGGCILLSIFVKSGCWVLYCTSPSRSDVLLPVVSFIIGLTVSLAGLVLVTWPLLMFLEALS